MKYIEKISKNGVINCYPILTEEEKEARHQDFLKVANEIIRKYTNGKKETKPYKEVE